MTELWTPPTDRKPDPENLFDIMAVLQEDLDATPARETKIAKARKAVMTLSANLKHIDDADRKLVIGARLALVDKTVDPNGGALIKDIGLCGFLNEINCISVGKTLDVSITLNLNIIRIFSPGEPEYYGDTSSTGHAPIGHVDYIETISA